MRHGDYGWFIRAYRRVQILSRAVRMSCRAVRMSCVPALLAVLVVSGCASVYRAEVSAFVDGWSHLSSERDQSDLPIVIGQIDASAESDHIAGALAYDPDLLAQMAVHEMIDARPWVVQASRHRPGETEPAAVEFTVAVEVGEQSYIHGIRERRAISATAELIAAEGGGAAGEAMATSGGAQTGQLMAADGSGTGAGGDPMAAGAAGPGAGGKPMAAGAAVARAVYRGESDDTIVSPAVYHRVVSETVEALFDALEQAMEDE